MEFTLTVNMDNAAFAENGYGDELARILRRLAAKVEGVTDTCVVGGKVMDFNGNSTGTWEVR